ncbi:MAG: hypothetical protein RMK98_04325 [Bacteroidia bacterium]|nr:hypothetical protein [Bacteroidia bacterium]
MKRVLRLLLLGVGLGGVFAQYRLQGVVKIPQQPEVSTELRLSPGHLHYIMETSFQGKPVQMEFFFTPEKAYWIFPEEKRAYEVQPQRPYPQPVEKARLVEQLGTGVSKWELIFPKQLRLVTVWDSTHAFDWSRWDRYLEEDRLGAAARHFRLGLPREIIQYQADTLAWHFQVKDIQPYKSVSDQVPYPVTSESPIRLKGR